MKKTEHQTTLWLTGIPCSGKTTIAKRLQEELCKCGIRITHLDGDDLRAKLCADLGFSDADRLENLRRAAHIAELFNQNGHFVVATFITPAETMRKMIRGIVTHLILCHIKCSTKVCMKRDVKGMYKKARAGLIKNFTAVSAGYEIPAHPDLVVDTEHENLERCVQKILDYLESIPVKFHAEARVPKNISALSLASYCGNSSLYGGL